MTYYTRGVYRQSIDCCRWLVAALTGAQRHQRFGHQVLPAVVARYNLSRALSEMGAFAEGHALGAEGLRVAETVAHPMSLVFGYSSVGLPFLYKGDFDKAIPSFERAVGICQEADLRLHFPGHASFLGVAY